MDLQSLEQLSRVLRASAPGPLRTLQLSVYCFRGTLGGKKEWGSDSCALLWALLFFCWLIWSNFNMLSFVSSYKVLFCYVLLLSLKMPVLF